MRILLLIMLCGCCHTRPSTVVLFDHEYFQIDSQGLWTFYNITNSDGTVDGWIRCHGAVVPNQMMIKGKKP